MVKRISLIFIYTILFILLYNLLYGFEYEKGMVFFTDNTANMVIITFNKSVFDMAKNALEKKYNKPNLYSISTYVNKRGEIFEGKVYEWKTKYFLDITLIEHFSVTDNSALIYQFNHSNDRGE